jgi:DnaJ-class molecular chaperone
MNYFVTVKSSCPECQGTGETAAPIPHGRWIAPGFEAKKNQSNLAIARCLSCDGTGEIRTDAPFEDALRHTVASGQEERP